MATPNGWDSYLNRTRVARGKLKATKSRFNLPRKRTSLKPGSSGVLENDVHSSLKRTRLEHRKKGVLANNVGPDLWATLPLALAQEILAKLPFSSLVPLCSVSKQWRDLILSSSISPRCTSDHGHLFLFSNDKLTVFNSSRGTWEIVPLQFLQKHFTLLQVVSSAGGLLCFSTQVLGEYIVCNPLTKAFKKLQMPCSSSSSTEWPTDDHPCMPTPVDASRVTTHADLLSAFLVGMVLHPDTGHFKLIVAGLRSWSQGTTLVYNSNANLWKKVANVPEDVPQNRLSYKNAVRIVCGGNFYVHFRCVHPITGRLFKYDVELQEWHSIPMPQFRGIVQNIIECNGKILLVTSDHQVGGNAAVKLFSTRFLPFELQETGSKLWLPIDKLPISRVRERLLEMMDSKWLGQGGVMFFLRGSERCQLLGSDSNHRYSMKISVREWFHDTTTNSYSEVMSKWENFEGTRYFPQFQMFRPSMLGVR